MIEHGEFSDQQRRGEKHSTYACTKQKICYTKHHWKFSRLITLRSQTIASCTDYTENLNIVNRVDTRGNINLSEFVPWGNFQLPLWGTQSKLTHIPRKDDIHQCID